MLDEANQPRTLSQMGTSAEHAGPPQAADAALAADLAAGDQQALAELYDRYSDRIYSYCVSVCGNPEAAADAMQDSFLLAYARISQLRDPSKLRPWLYAIARNECLRQLRANKRTVDLELAGEVADMNATSDTTLNAADARSLIDDAFAGMNSGDRDVLDLALRQDLDNSSIAAVLAVSDNNAAAKVSRAKSQLEKAVGALLLFRSRASGCAVLDREIGPDTAFTPLARKRISRHAENCTQCSKSRAKSIAAIALAGLPLLAAPSWLRETLLNSATPPVGNATTAADVEPTPQASQTPDGQSGSPNGDDGSSADSSSSHVDPQGGESVQSAAPADVESAGSVSQAAPESQEAAHAPGDANQPVYIASSQGKVPPLSFQDKAAQLSKVRPAFDRKGWPIAGKKGPRRWPLVVGLAAVIVLLGVMTGLAITSEGQEPAAATSSQSGAPVVQPSQSPAPTSTPSAAASKSAESAASARPTTTRTPGSSASPSSTRSKPKPKPTSKPKPTTATPTPTPTPGGPGTSRPRPGGPGGIAPAPVPTPG